MPGEPDKGPNSLEALRVQIDALDERIVALLNERARVVVQIGKFKQQNNSPIYAPDREKTVLQKVRKLNAGPCPTGVWRPFTAS
jgi:chorismate mutase/prephenate dehydratase